MANEIRTNEFQSIRTNMSALVREETLEGEPRLAIPVILMVEGVHNGILYTAEELAKFPEAWNGRPVPIYHPKDAKTGAPISANAPKIKEKRVTGEIFNAHFEDGKLKAEAWIDPVKANKIDASVMTKLEAEEMLEVSTGLYMDYETKAGVWNDESYSEIALNFRPDHLAILPTIEGACSVRDGAGMPRINEKDTQTVGAMSRVKQLFQKGLDWLSTNELSHDDIRFALRNLVSEKVSINPNQGDYIFVRDVYDKSFIYERESPAGFQLFKQGYNVNDEEAVTLDGEAVEVKEKVEFVPVINEEDEKSKKVKTNNKGEIPMENDRKTKIDTLIANEAVGFGEDDREFLVGLNDAQFEKIEKMIPAEEAKKDVPKEVPAKPVVNADEKPVVKDEPETKAPTFDEMVANASPEQRDMIENGIAMATAKRLAIIDGILAVNQGFSKEELEAKNLTELEKLAGLARVKSDFSANAGNKVVTANAEDEAPMEAPTMQAKKAE